MAGSRKPTFVWTNEEAELLLQVTLDYKTKKLQENVDWESCLSKYADITEQFAAQYPQQPDRNKFPHDPSTITRAQLTAKLKAIRSKFRAAVDTGKRSGQGRVVYEYFELCSEIWAGSPATSALESGFESVNLQEESLESSSSTAPGSPDSQHFENETNGSQPAARSINRRDLLKSSLTGHRTNRLKRKIPAEHFMQEDLKAKMKMLEVMEDSARRLEDRLEESAKRTEEFSRRSLDSLDSITSSIQETLSLMRQYLLPPHTVHPHHHFMSGSYPTTSHHPSSLHKHTQTSFMTPNPPAPVTPQRRQSPPPFSQAMSAIEDD